MGTLVTTVDLGNTRGKACDWWLEQAGPATRLRSAAVDGAWVAAWSAAQRRGWAQRWIALSSVAERETELALRAELQREFGASFVGTPDSGLDNATREPERVGRDRLFAARGAFELVGESALIVDVGTAMTVDALAVASSGARPRFLGGAIAPGPRLLAEALARGTAQLPSVEPRADAAPLGVDTRGAIEAGIAHGLRGAARELVARIAEAAGLALAPVVITGGASAFLKQLDFDGRRVIDSEDLVHIGLACATLDSAAGSSSVPRRYARWSAS